jgi:hypothetical protein
MASQTQDQIDLAQRIKVALINCVGYEGDELANSRKMAYDYYFQRARGDEIAGRSQVVSGDLSSMVEGNLATMSEPLGGKRIAEFCSYDQTDEEQAQLETDCVHEMLFKRQNGFMEVVSSIKDALLVRNGVVKVYVDERTFKKTVNKTNVAPEVITHVLDKIGATDIHSYDPKDGSLSATVTKTTRKFRVETLAPENFLFPKFWHKQDLDDIPFCAERHVEPRSTLIERGFPRWKVNRLRRYNNPYQASADARLPRQISPNNTNPIDKSQELVEWYETYLKMEESDGTAMLHRVCVSDQYVLDDSEADNICYATGVCIINPHSFIGISLFDKLKSTQDSSTALNRALQDNLNATNKNRTAHLDGLVEESDLNDGRTNGSIRVKPGVVADVRAAITAFAVPDTSANILANIEHMRRVRSEMGGATLDMATGQMQLNDRVGSMGLDRAYSVMEQLAAFMTRMLANTLIRNMYLIAHETLRTQWPEVIQFKRGNQWVKTNPSEWQVRESVTVNLGASQGERQRVSAVLDSLISKMATLAQNGMEDVLVNVQGFYTACMDWLRINDIDTPEKYFIDPRSEPAQKALKGKAQATQAAQQKQDNMMQQAMALEQLRVALEKYQGDAELQYKYYDTVLGAQIEEAKLAVQGVLNLVQAKQQSQQAMQDGNRAADFQGSKGPPTKQAATDDIGPAGGRRGNGMESGADNDGT